MTDAIFLTEPATSPPTTLVREFRSNVLNPPAQPRIQNAIPVVPPLIAQGAANAEGALVLASKGTLPLSTPLYGGTSSILAAMSTGAATAQNVP